MHTSLSAYRNHKFFLHRCSDCCWCFQEYFKKIADKNIPATPASDFLIFHVHGGGFVSHTSESHLVYLKEWAAWTEVPILSVDYSLAPQAPYPRALEEILYAYVWMLNNAEHLGSAAKRIVFAGL